MFVRSKSEIRNIVPLPTIAIGNDSALAMMGSILYQMCLSRKESSLSTVTNKVKDFSFVTC